MGLHKSMYYIILNVSICDFLFSTTTLPKIISRYWFQSGSISFTGCFVQMYFVHYLGSVNSFIFSLMAFDRFVAICIPLRYPVLITNNIIFTLCGSAWFLPLPLMMIILFQALSLSYCRSNIILQCYCDHISLVSQACGNDLKTVQVIALCVAIFCLLVPLAFILISYVSIIIVILKMSNSAGRIRTLATCTPQIFITCLFYLPRCFVYVANTVGFSFSLDVRILLILLYSLLPAAVNPIIYCFKTQDIKHTLMKKIKATKIGIELKVWTQ
ncbi:olfactory receptor 2AT4-like [Fundulus diaphanus]